MHPSVPQHRAPRPGRWRLALLSSLAIVAVTGGTLLVAPQQRVHAQPPGAPPSFADLVERVKPAVVSIQVTNGQKVSGNVPKYQPRDPRGDPRDPRGDPRDPRGDPRDPRGDPRGRPGPGDRQTPGPGGPGDTPPPYQDDGPLNEFFKKWPREGVPRPLQAQGSGFVISPDGFVVTNNHVIADASKVQIIFDQDNRYEAEIVGTDEKTDLALLKIKAQGKTFPYVAFASTTPRVGEWVIAVGNPFGLGGTVTAGIVSAHGRDIGPGPYDYMQIDAAVNKGNSGGPSFNLQGEVVGVNTAIYSPTGVSVGIAFAIPARTANEVIKQLQETGSVKRGWLGVKIQNVDEDTAASLGLGEAKGALVSEVTGGSPAAEAGLKSGDTILSVNGSKIADSRDLARQIAAFTPGSKIDVRVLRSQKEQNIQVKLGLMPSTQDISRLGPPSGGKGTQPTELQQLGLTVAPPTGQNRDGLVVTEVDPSSDAARKVRVGDVILEISGSPVTRPEDLANGVREANRLQRRAVLMRIRSGNETRFVAVQLRRG
jgi:serine protease Do